MAENHQLDRELEKVRRAEERYGWANDFAKSFVAVLSLCGSIVASVLVVLERPKFLTAVVAGIPAAVVAITKIFPFETRALAHWAKEYRLHGLQLKLRYEGVELRTVSEEFREIEAKTFDKWPLLGSLPAEGREPGSMSPVEKSQKGAAAGS